MSASPFFSIVIPTYNRAAYILQTLDSVFSQTFTDYEVIVVDNYSTDNTEELLKPLIEKGKIRFIKHEKNFERAKSRNTGMKNARGMYLTFLDSDDFMYPENLKDAYDYIVAHPGAHVFHNLYELVNEQKKVVYRYDFPSLRDPLLAISKGNFMSCIGCFIDKEVYQSVFWDETPILTGFEDYDFWVRVLAKYPEVGRIKRVNSAILSHPTRSVNLDAVKTAIERSEYFFSKLDSDTAIKKAYGSYINLIKSTIYIYISYMGRMSSQKKVTSEYLKRAYQTNPRIIAKRGFWSLLYHSI